MAAGMTCMETAVTGKPRPAEKTNPSASAPRFALAALTCSAAAAVSSLLLWMCFQPLAWGFLGWIALVPFLVLVRAQMRPSLAYGNAFLCGLAFYVPALQWMSVADKSMVAAWLALSFYCALYFAAALYCIRRLEAMRLPLVVSMPLVWISLEYLRSFFMSGFAWYYLAHTQHEYLTLIQITDLGGVYLVSFLVAAVNALLFDIAYQFPEVRRWFNQAEFDPCRTYSSVEFLNRAMFAEWLFRRNLMIEAGVVVVLFFGTIGYGTMRLAQSNFQPGPTVCLLQSNLDQRLRESAAAAGGDPRLAAERISEHFAGLCTRAAQTKPDLIIWPETSFPDSWVQVSPKMPIENVPVQWRDGEADIRASLKMFADNFGKVHRAPHLLGMNAHYLDSAGRHLRYNSAILLSGKGEVAGKFDKLHPVPFGEYLPLKDWFVDLSWLTPYEGDFGIQKGDKFTRFELGKHRFGVLICYEDTDPFLARRYAEKSDDGEPVDFLVNISNDGWFDGSSEHEEHLAVSRFRAIEARRAMVRAVNMGVSAVIDSNGRVLKPTEVPGTDPPTWRVSPGLTGYAELPVAEWHDFKKKPGILRAVVPIDHRFSFYVLAGDWLPASCWAIVLGGLSWSIGLRIGSGEWSSLGIGIRGVFGVVLLLLGAGIVGGLLWSFGCGAVLLSSVAWALMRRKPLAAGA